MYKLCLWHISRAMRKSLFCICEKGVVKLHGIDTTIHLLPKSVISSLYKAIYCGCTAPFVCHLVGNPEDRFFMTRLILYYLPTHHQSLRQELHVTKYQNNGSRKQLIYIWKLTYLVRCFRLLWFNCQFALPQKLCDGI